MTQTAREGGGKVWLLTATPLKNRPNELWNVLRLASLEREAFGGWRSFMAAFRATSNRFGGIDWGTPTEEVPAMLRRVMLRRIKSDVLADLPAKTRRTISVEIDKATAKACDLVLAAIEASQPGKAAVGVETAVDKLASSSLGFEDLSAARAALSRAKIPAMLEIVEAHEGEETPLVVFSAFRAPIDLLGTREGWATITGDTSNARRGEIVEQFQAGRLKGVACTIRAGGVAITLTHASNVLRVDREWNPSLNVQAEDRCYRIGQKSAVLVTDLVAAHKLDELISDVLARKEALISSSIDAATVLHVAPAVPVTIDWAAIEREAAQAVLKIAAADKAAQSAQGERAKKAAEARANMARNNARSRVRAAAARRLGEDESEIDAPRRGPVGEVEAWAIAGIRQLAADDPDRCKEKNEIGFSASDGSIGHALAWIGDLTEQEWRLALRIARHYPGQIGSAPGAREAA